MSLQSYDEVRPLASLTPATIAGLTTYLLGREPDEELVAIAVDGTGPIHLSTRPLADLDGEEGCERFASELAPVGATGLWLVGFADDLTDVPAAVAGLLDPLGELGLEDPGSFLAVTADGTRWGYVSDHVDQTDPGALEPVAAIDPAEGRLAALAIRARCAQHRETVALRLTAADTGDEEQLAAQGLYAQLRAMAAPGAGLERADRRSLIGCLDSPGPITTAEAINLGLALADNPGLMAEAIDRIWTADTAEAVRLDLWCRIAKAVTGPALAATATLVALAAWRTGDPLATTSIRIALQADARHPLARLMSEALACGVPAATLGLSSMALHQDETGPAARKGI